MAQAAPTQEPDSEHADFQAFVWRNLPRNFAAHLFHGLLGQTGFRLIQAPTFVPAYLQLLSGSDLVVGLARGIQSFGMCTTPFFSATLVERRRRVLPLGFLVGALMRLQVLFFALAGLVLVGDARIAAILFFLGLFGVFMGMQGVIFNTLMSKVIPVERRGILSGLRNALAGIVSSSVALAGGIYLIEPNVFGNGYAVTFLIAFVLTSLGLGSLLFMREPESVNVRERTNVAGRLSQLPALLRADPDFTAFFVARALGGMGRMGLPFCILYARDVVTVGGLELGIITTGWQLASTTSNLVWGILADRTGYRLIFLLSMAIWIASVAFLMVATTLTAVVLVFIGIGAGMGGYQMSSQNMVLEFGETEDVPLRIATANSAAELLGAAGPILGGLIAMTYSYPVVFWITIGVQMVALLLMFFRVREPRHLPATILE